MGRVSSGDNVEVTTGAGNGRPQTLAYKNRVLKEKKRSFMTREVASAREQGLRQLCTGKP